jgi:hypothetical protein
MIFSGLLFYTPAPTRPPTPIPTPTPYQVVPTWTPTPYSTTTPTAAVPTPTVAPTPIVAPGKTWVLTFICNSPKPQCLTQPWTLELTLTTGPNVDVTVVPK